MCQIIKIRSRIEFYNLDGNINDFFINPNSRLDDFFENLFNESEDDAINNSESEDD